MGTAEKYNSGYASPAKQGKKLSQRRRGSWEGLLEPESPLEETGNLKYSGFIIDWAVVVLLLLLF